MMAGGALSHYLEGLVGPRHLRHHPLPLAARTILQQVSPPAVTTAAPPALRQEEAWLLSGSGLRSAWRNKM